MCLADESVLIYATASGYGYRVEVRNKAEQCSFSPLDVDHTECVWFQFFFLTFKCECLVVQEALLKVLKIKEKYFSCIVSFHCKSLNV